MSDDEAEMAAMRARRGQQSVRSNIHSNNQSNEDDDDYEAMRTMMFPTEFGAKKQRQPAQQTSNKSIDQSPNQLNDTIDDVIVKPEPSINQSSDETINLSSLISQYSLNTKCPTLPLTHHQTINQSTNQVRKPVQSLSLSSDGSLMLAGSADYTLSFFEFQSMNQAFRPTVSITVLEGQPVIDQSINLDCSIIAVATMSSSIKLIDRRGATISQTVDGDRYLVDQKRTKGHTASVTAIKFHPTKQSSFLSGGRDGVIRLWDVNQTNNVDVIKARSAPARGLSISSIDCSADGKMIVSASTDGSLRTYSTSAPNAAQLKFTESSATSNVAAHKRGCWVSSVKFSRDGRQVFSRGGEGENCVKIWDVRAPRQPFVVIEGLECGHEQSDMAEAPDSSLLLVPCATGQLAIVDMKAAKPELVCLAPIQSRSLIRAVWHPVINQIFVSGADGTISAFYDKQLSKRGMLQCINRVAGKRSYEPETDDVSSAMYSYNPSIHQTINQGPAKSARSEATGPIVPSGPPTERLTATQIAMKSILKQRVNPLTVKPEEALRTIQTLAQTQAQERRGR